jgi:uncharacterized protein (TIGR00255 family)
LIVEAKSVNHRFLEVRSRAPREILAVEPLFDKLAHRRLKRGHLTVLVTLEGATGAATRIADESLQAQLEQLRAIADRNDLSLADLTPLLAGSPDLFTSVSTIDRRDLERAAEQAFSRAIDGLLEMREKEGAAMAGELERQLAVAQESVTLLERLLSKQAGLLLDRARGRVATLLAGTDVKVDSSRIEAEAALLADRADVTEEIARLGSHADQLRALLGEDAPVGRRIEFLVQEMGREANTLAAKAALPEATHATVELKAQLEKIREIAQNVE